ncbi:hypothetical protein DFJ74DRAFT_691305 [Hyaloraphidium curvatum]|nr:hypothetical protein DFJ74DRAFT_691305 [Hyaloraphidium curvatum]
MSTLSPPARACVTARRRRSPNTVALRESQRRTKVSARSLTGLSPPVPPAGFWSCASMPGGRGRMAPGASSAPRRKSAPPKKPTDYPPAERKVLVFADVRPPAAADAVAEVFLFPIRVYGSLLRSLLGMGSNSNVSLPAGSLVVTNPAATSAFKFPPGHPVMSNAYVLHPLSKDRYIPAAAFHRALFEEKVSELITLLAALGATRVRVAAKQGYNSAGGISIGISTPRGDPAAGQQTKSSNSSLAIFEERFTPKGSAKVPSKLLWFEHEPTWKHLAQRRMKYKTTTFQAELRYEDSYGIDRNLKAGLKGFGIEFGQNFTDFQTTVWEFEGEFSELKKEDCTVM